MEKTHYRKAFNSPYLSSADIVEPTNLTISHVRLEPDKTKKTKDLLNTAYFVEREIRKGEALKPMVLNATNSKMLAKITKTAFLEDWQNIHVTVYVDSSVRFGKDTVEGLRLTAQPPKRWLTPENENQWRSAIDAVKRDGNLKAVLSRVSMSEEHQILIMKQAGVTQ